MTQRKQFEAWYASQDQSDSEPERTYELSEDDWSTGHVIDPYHDEKLVDAAIAALEKELSK